MFTPKTLQDIALQAFIQNLSVPREFGAILHSRSLTIKLIQALRVHGKYEHIFEILKSTIVCRDIQNLILDILIKDTKGWYWRIRYLRDMFDLEVLDNGFKEKAAITLLENKEYDTLTFIIGRGYLSDANEEIALKQLIEDDNSESLYNFVAYSVAKYSFKERALNKLLQSTSADECIGLLEKSISDSLKAIIANALFPKTYRNYIFLMGVKDISDPIKKIIVKKIINSYKPDRYKDLFLIITNNICVRISSVNSLNISDSIKEICVRELIEHKEYARLESVISSKDVSDQIKEISVRGLIENKAYTRLERVISSKDVSDQIKEICLKGLIENKEYTGLESVISSKDVSDQIKEISVRGLIENKEYTGLESVISSEDVSDKIKEMCLKGLIENQRDRLTILVSIDNFSDSLKALVVDQRDRLTILVSIDNFSDSLKALVVDQLVKDEEYDYLLEISEGHDISDEVRQKALEFVYKSELASSAMLLALCNGPSLYGFIMSEDLSSRRILAIGVLVRVMPYPLAANAAVQAWSILPKEYKESLVCNLIYKPVSDYLAPPPSCSDYKEISIKDGLVRSAYSFGFLLCSYMFHHTAVKVAAQFPGIISIGFYADIFNKLLAVSALDYIIVDSLVAWRGNDEIHEIAGESGNATYDDL